VGEASVIRLFTFRAVRPAFDQILRDVIVPDLCIQAGIVDCYSARQGPDEIGPRIVASVWRSRSELVAALGEELEAGAFHPDYLDETTDRVLEVVPLEIAEHFEAGEPARILRILRGTVAAGEKAAYVEDVRTGMRIDVASSDGPVALYLASNEGDSFITVSAWRKWADIELATGGDVHRPRATRRPERLVDWDVSHFEIVRSS
jgi:hypothetical protein